MEKQRREEKFSKLLTNKAMNISIL